MRAILKVLLPLVVLGTTFVGPCAHAFAPPSKAKISEQSNTLVTYRDGRDYAYVPWRAEPYGSYAPRRAEPYGSYAPRRAEPYGSYAERYYYSAPATGYPGPRIYQQAPPQALWYAPPPILLVPVRPASCGRYRYWNGEYCADARYDPPYVGPRW